MSDKEKQIGLKDQPIECRDEEVLGLGEYADALTEFIRHCDTPLSIALQGDWGSGKTSLMTLIRNALKDESNEGETYLTVWFNTWQYAQFNKPDTLALSMISRITDQLASNTDDAVIQTVRQVVWAAMRVAAIYGAGLIGQAETAKEALNEAERTLGASQTTDPATALERIKEGLADIVRHRIGRDAKKVVVFIDDLDRLVPVRAVELLEAIKVFLDIEECVYVIACDYSIIVTGLKEKFGVTGGELQGRTFFDKIIQVPFRMPVRQYQVDQYIETLLERTGLDFRSDVDIDTYRDLVHYSVGFNPRTMKRLLNTLQLLTILDDRRNKHDSSPSTDRDAMRRHVCRVTFGILCMLDCYEPIYDHITENLSAQDLLALRDGILTSSKYENLRNGIGNDSIDNAQMFCKLFIDCLQLDEEEELSDDEIRHLENMLSHSALVSARKLQKEFSPRDFTLKLKDELNKNFSQFVKPSRDRTKRSFSFTIFRGAVDLKLPIPRGSTALQFYADKDHYYFELSSTSRDLAKQTADRLCKEFSWKVREVRHQRHRHRHIFFQQSREASDALQVYKDELYGCLKSLTENREKLIRMCNEIADQ